MRRFFDPNLAGLAALAARLEATMVIDYNIALANAALNAIYDTNFPAGSFVDIRTGAPTGADNAAGGTLLDSITLPASPWAAASASSKSKSGTWQANATAAGVAGNGRLRNAASTMVEEMTASATGGGGDIILDNTNVAVGQSLTVSTFQRTL